MAYDILQNENVYCTVWDLNIGPTAPCFEDNIDHIGNLNIQGNEDVYVNPTEEFMDFTTQQKENHVLCNECIHAPLPALKYCWMCHIHLCQLHLRTHSNSEHHVFRSHVKRAKSKCPNQNEIQNVYCPDKRELYDEASQRKKRDILNQFNAKQKEMEENVHRLQKHTMDVDDKAAKMTGKVTSLFQHIRKQFEALEMKVLNEISLEQEQSSRPSILHIKELEQKQTELSEKRQQFEQLCRLGNPAIALSIGHRLVDSEYGDCMVYDTKKFDEGLISATLKRSIDNIMTGIKWEQGISDLFLDVNTAANDVYLSGDKKTVSWTKIKQGRQKTPKRFKGHQVLATEGFSSGRHYWEVETSETGKWIIGMCYPSVDKKGEESFIGKNNKSWGLAKLSEYSVVHDLKEKHIPSLASICKLGIYLDYEAGQLSFYELSDPIKHLHTYNAKFTEPLYPVFWVWYSWVRLKS